MNNDNNENKFQGDTLPGEDDAPLVANFEHVKVITHPEKFNFEMQGDTYTGFITYTEGLEESLGYELIAFSNEKPTEEDEFGLRGTASMLSINVPHLIPVDLHPHMVQYLHMRGIPQNARVQAVCDVYALDHDGPTTPETAEWSPDGGTALFSQLVLTHAVDQFFSAMDQQKEARAEELMAIQRGHIEKVGFTQVGVFDPTGEAPVFIYTVGLSNMNLPELFISGRFDAQAMSHIVGQAFTRFKDLGRFEEMEFEQAVNIEIGGEEQAVSVRVVRKPDPRVIIDNYMTRAEMILERPVTDVAVMQFSDLEKRYPGELLFDNIFGQLDEVVVPGVQVKTFEPTAPVEDNTKQ